jgi:hypothetical protein
MRSSSKAQSQSNETPPPLPTLFPQINTNESQPQSPSTESKFKGNDPLTTMNLRISFLYLLLYGSHREASSMNGIEEDPLSFAYPSTSKTPKKKSKSHDESEPDESQEIDSPPEISVIRQLLDLETTLRETLDGSKSVDKESPPVRDLSSIRRFVASYDTNKPLLTPPSLNSGPEVSPLDYISKTHILLSSYQDIISLDRDLRKLELLSGKETLGTVNSASSAWSEHTPLDVLLESLIDEAIPQAIKGQDEVEGRAEALVKRYYEFIDTLNELFVEWNGEVEDLEYLVAKMERDLIEEQKKR